MRAEYAAYIDAQLAKTRRMVHARPPRVESLARLLASAQEPPSGKHVLCVGCRNDHELVVLRAVGYKATGIDLMASPGVLEMDFHELDFPDAHFDAVFSCHSLEHAFNYELALREWDRVTKPGGAWAIEVPVKFTPTDVDRHDFGSVIGLWNWLEPYRHTLLYAERSMGRDPGAVRILCT